MAFDEVCQLRPLVSPIRTIEIRKLSNLEEIIEIFRKTKWGGRIIL